MPFQDRPQRLVQSLAAVEDDQQSGFVLQAALDQVGQEASADPLVLGGRLHEAQRDLLSLQSDAQGDEDLLVGEALAVEEQRHQVVSLQGSFLEFGQLSRRAFHVAARHRGTGQAEGTRDGLGAGLVVARSDAFQHAQQQALVLVAGRLQSLVDQKRHLGPAGHIAHPRHLDAQFLVAQIHRSGLRPPSAQRLPGPLALIARPDQLLDRPLQLLGDGLQPQGDQALDGLEASVQILDQSEGVPIHGADFQTAFDGLLAS